MTNPAVDRKSVGDELDPMAGYVGYGVYDPLGQRIGRADKIFVNGNDEPEYIRVKVGVFGWKLVLLPVESVAIDEERRSITLK